MENQWKFYIDGNVDVYVFLFDCNLRAVRGTGSPVAISNYSSGGDRSEQKVLGWQQLSPFKPLACQLLLLILVAMTTVTNGVATWTVTWLP